MHPAQNGYFEQSDSVSSVFDSRQDSFNSIRHDFCNKSDNIGNSYVSQVTEKGNCNIRHEIGNSNESKSSEYCEYAESINFSSFEKHNRESVEPKQATEHTSFEKHNCDSCWFHNTTQHTSFDCFTLLRMSGREVSFLARQKGICQICGFNSHDGTCPYENYHLLCSITECRRRHNILFCSKRKGESQEGSSEDSENRKSSDNLETNAMSNNLGSTDSLQNHEDSSKPKRAERISQYEGSEKLSDNLIFSQSDTETHVSVPTRIINLLHSNNADFEIHNIDHSLTEIACEDKIRNDYQLPGIEKLSHATQSPISLSHQFDFSILGSSESVENSCDTLFEAVSSTAVLCQKRLHFQLE